MEMADLLQLSIKRNASDLHILPELPPLLRIDGELVKLKEYPILSAATTKYLIYSFLSNNYFSFRLVKTQIFSSFIKRPILKM